MHWWVIPVVLSALGVLTLVSSWLKSRKAPKWNGAWPFVFPNMVGVGSYIVGLILIFMSIVFVAGHYIK